MERRGRDASRGDEEDERKLPEPGDKSGKPGTPDSHGCLSSCLVAREEQEVAVAIQGSKYLPREENSRWRRGKDLDLATPLLFL